MKQASFWLAALLAAGFTASNAQASTACPFSAADISKALGVPVQEGKPGLEFSAAGMVMRDCRYASKNFSVMVKTSHYSNPAAAKDATKMLADKLRAIPNDPDGAVIQEGQGDLTDPAVFYVRNGVAVELRVLGIYYKDLKSKDADLRDMQTKLAAVKRLQ